MMTRKDYIRTAEILKANQEFIHPATFSNLIKEFGNYFANDNSRFDFSKFENASRGEN